MADTKITALTALTAADPANDVIPIVDVSDTTMAASGTTKKISVNNILSSSPTASGALTVTGLVTAGSATITGAATVGTTLGVTGVTTLTGSVGIGAASSAKLSVTDTNGIPLRFGDIATAPTSQTACFVGTATGGLSGSINGDLILAPRTSDAGSVVVYTGNGTSAERLRVTAAGNVNITTGNVVMATSGKGIDFSATANGSGTMTSELLNDYEEGTFTPTVRGSTVAGTGVYTTQAGLYTKVGRLVTVTVYLNWTAVTLGTGNLQFAGLPFTASSSPVTYNGISIGFVSNIATTAGTVLYGIVEPGSTVITMTQTPTGGGAYGLVPLDTSGEIAFTSTYYV